MPSIEPAYALEVPDQHVVNILEFSNELIVVSNYSIRRWSDLKNRKPSDETISKCKILQAVLV